MKFALLLFDDETFHDLSTSEHDKVMLAHQAFVDSLVEAGAMVGGEPLDRSSNAVTRFVDGRVQDGPFVDSKEQLGGFYLIDVPSKEAALSWAAKVPLASGAVEVRPIPDYAE
ncbi:MAG: YciI family protein [Pseudomonadota bacterium]